VKKRNSMERNRADLYDANNYTWDPDRSDTIIQIADLRFGIEMELLSNTNLTRAQIVQILKVNNIEAREAVYRGSNYDVWQIKPDRSLEPQQGSFELVSPILRGEKGCAIFKKVLEILKSNIESLYVNETCGLHVHIDMKNVPLPHLKAICQNLLKYEYGLDLVLLPERRNNPYVKSNRNTMLNLTNEQVFHRIANCNSISEIKDVMNPGRDRYYKFNLQRLTDIGTIEIRVHHGTTDFAEVKNWVKLLIRLFSFSVYQHPMDCLRDDRDPTFALYFMFKYVILRDHLTKYYLQKAIHINSNIDQYRALVNQYQPIIDSIPDRRNPPQMNRGQLNNQLQNALTHNNIHIVYQ